MTPEDAKRVLAGRRRTTGAATAALDELAELLCACDDAVRVAKACLGRLGRGELLRSVRQVMNGQGLPASMAVWRIAFAAVAQAFPASADILRLMALLGDAPLPCDVVVHGAEVLGPAVEAVLDQSDSDRSALQFLVEPLVRSGLLAPVGPDEPLSAPPAFRTSPAGLMDTETRREWAGRAVRAVARTFPMPAPRNALLCELLVPHARACAMLLAEEGLVEPEAPGLLNRVGLHLMEQGGVREAEGLFRAAAETGERCHGPDHVLTTAGLCHLASLHETEGCHDEAGALRARVLEIWERSLGPAHPRVAAGLCLLAGTCEARGHSEEACVLRDKALAARPVDVEHGRAGLSTCLRRLAGLYAERGSLAQAGRLFRAALSEDERVHGPTSPESVTAMNSFAVHLLVEGRIEEAETLFKMAVETAEHHPGPCRSPLAAILDNYALLLLRQGRHTEAAQILARALSACELAAFPGPS